MTPCGLTRRELLWQTGAGFTGLALTAMLAEDGFFAKDVDPKPYLTEGWQDRVQEKFKGVYPESLLRFYTAHLACELLQA